MLPRSGVAREGKMKFARLLALIAAMMIVLGSDEALAQDKVAEVIAVKGSMFVVRGGKAQALAVGQPVQQGDQLNTPPGCGAKIKFTDGSTLAIGENTVLTVHTYAQQGTKRTAIFEMLSGILRAIVPRASDDSAFAVRTPLAVASVRSTDWMFAAKPDMSQVFVGEGAVAVRSIEPRIVGEVVVMPGDGTDVLPGKAPTAPAKWGPGWVRNFEEQTTVD